MCQSADSIQPTKKQIWTNCNRVLKWCHKKDFSEIMGFIWICSEQPTWKKFTQKKMAL